MLKYHLFVASLAHHTKPEDHAWALNYVKRVADDSQAHDNEHTLKDPEGFPSHHEPLRALRALAYIAHNLDSPPLFHRLAESAQKYFDKADGIRELFAHLKDNPVFSPYNWIADDYDRIGNKIIELLGRFPLQDREGSRKEAAEFLDILESKMLLDFPITKSEKQIHASVDLFLRSIYHILADCPNDFAFAGNWAEFVANAHSDWNFSVDEWAWKLFGASSLYVCRQKKPFERFEADYREMGRDVTLFYDVEMRYSRLFPRGEFPAVMNHLIKKKHKQYLWKLLSVRVPDDTLQIAIDRSVGSAGDKTAEMLVKLIDVYTIGSMGSDQPIGWHENFNSRLRAVRAECGIEGIVMELDSIGAELAYAVTEGLPIPAGLQDMVQGMTFAYYMQKNQEDRNTPAHIKKIVQWYLSSGPQQTNHQIHQIPQNQSLRMELGKRFNLEPWENGIIKKYSLRTDESSINAFKARIAREVEEVKRHCHDLGIRDTGGEFPYQLIRDVESSIGSYISKRHPLALDIQAHLEKIRGMSGLIVAEEDSVLFYLCKDPVETLAMGHYLHTCLNFDQDNFWAAVANVLHFNEGCFYAKDSQGRIIGRNRIALANEGVIATQFYQNSSLSMCTAWLDVLLLLAAEMKAPLHIPEIFATEEMKKTLGRLVNEGRGSYSTNAILHLKVPIIEDWYGDGLPVAIDKKDNMATVTFNGYSIRP